MYPMTGIPYWRTEVPGAYQYTISILKRVSRIILIRDIRIMEVSDEKERFALLSFVFRISASSHCALNEKRLFCACFLEVCIFKIFRDRL